MKFINSLQTTTFEAIINLKAKQLLDSWLDTHGDEEGGHLPHFAEEELLSDFDRQFGTDLLEQARWFYEMLDKVIINPEEES